MAGGGLRVWVWGHRNKQGHANIADAISAMLGGC